MMKSLLIALLVAAVACKGDAGSKPATSAPADPVGAKAEPQPEGIAWIHDDYPSALAAAKRQRKPLLIDMWAE